MKHLTVWLLFVGLAAAEGEADWFALIRQDGTAALRKRLAAGETVPGGDVLGNTPLHYAALYGPPNAVELLLQAGASPNARNGEGVTPFLCGATDLAKTKLMLARGADVKAVSDKGRTALHVAVGSTNGLEIARLLIEKGADVNAVDKARGDTPLNLINGKYPELTRLLLAKGARAKTAGATGVTPLMNAANLGSPEQLKLLLAGDSEVIAATALEDQNPAGKLAVERRFPLLFAAQSARPDLVAPLLAAGADVKQRDVRGMTALMFVVPGDRPSAGAVRALLAAGADVNAKDNNGESVLDWARKTPHPEILRLLQEAGATGAAVAPVAARPHRTAPLEPLPQTLSRAMQRIEVSSPVLFKKAGCVACHHQPAAVMAAAAMREAGLPFDVAAAEAQAKSLLSARSNDVLQGIEFGGRHDSAMYALDAAMAYRVPANAAVDAMVQYLAHTQNADGAWGPRGSLASRPPAQDSNIHRTAHNAKILRHHGWPARQTGFERAIARARTWLEQAEPVAQV